MEDEKPQPEPAKSARYWRLNRLSAYRMMMLDPSQAETPGELQNILDDLCDKKQLEAREKAIKDRYNRLLNRALEP